MTLWADMAAINTKFELMKNLEQVKFTALWEATN